MNSQPALAALSRGLNFSGLWTLFVLTLRQHLRGRRLLILGLLFLLPTVLAAIVRFTPHAPPSSHLEFVLVFYFIPHALATLTALLYSAGIIQDEVEEQTLTYLLLRPIPRWALFGARLAATLVVTIGLTAVFTVLALSAIYWNTPELWGAVLPDRALKIVSLLALVLVGYCTLFALIGMTTRWSLIVGILYIVIFEGLLANVPSVVRRMTMMYYFRVLAVRWLDPPDSKVWALDMETEPSASSCVWTLVGAAVLFALVSAIVTMRREFRMKTPEGS